MTQRWPDSSARSGPSQGARPLSLAAAELMLLLQADTSRVRERFERAQRRLHLALALTAAFIAMLDLGLFLHGQ